VIAYSEREREFTFAKNLSEWFSYSFQLLLHVYFLSAQYEKIGMYPDVVMADGQVSVFSPKFIAILMPNVDAIRCISLFVSTNRN